MAGVLQTELDFFEENRHEWFKHHAYKVALIKGTKVYGFYDNYDNALEAGYNTLGMPPWLIKRVLLQDKIERIF